MDNKADLMNDMPDATKCFLHFNLPSIPNI